MPTHTYSVPGGKRPFTKDEPSVVGHITNVLRQRPGAVRSRSATHSSAAIGKYAKELMENQCMTYPLAPESPLARVVERGGKILLLGVGHTANTAIHMAETIADTGYTTVPFDGNSEKLAWYLDEHGREVIIRQTEIPGCSRHFGVMEGILKLAGITRYGVVGEAVSQLMTASELIDKTVETLNRAPDFLLCYDPKCPVCRKRRDYLKKKRKTVEKDPI